VSRGDPGVRFADAAGARNGALWYWRFTFHTHWGRHAAGALYALSWLLSEYEGAGDPF
jgi:hypothetical protein